MLQRTKISIATNGSGAFSQSVQMQSGYLKQVRYVVDGSNALDTGWDLSITEDDTGVNLLTMANAGTSSFTRLPRDFVANHADGVVSTTNVDAIAVVGDITVTIAAGGASKVGVLYLYIDQ